MYKISMWEKNQLTLKNQANFSGIGLHSGIKVEVTLEPANSNSGIVFRRTDLEKDNEIVANFKNVSSAKLCTKIENSSGTFKRGYLEAELDIKDDLWFFKCHFQNDPVMPGCLGLDAMWQLVGFYLGWTGEPGKGRALGVSTVKFTGEVLKKIKMATYKINIKRILKKEGAVVGLANGTLDADGKVIYVAENLKVGLFKS